MSGSSFFKIVKELYVRFKKDEISALGAQVTYYLILSFFPFLIFLVSLLSYTSIVSTDSLSVLSGFLPASVYNLVKDLAGYVLATRSNTFISIGMIVTIWSAAAGIMAFMNGINKAFKRKETRSFFKVKGLALLFTFAFAILLILSIGLVIFGEILGRHFFSLWGVPERLDIVWDIFRYAVSLLVIFITFMFFYVYVPNCKIRFREALPGSILSTVGWAVLSTGFAFYVNRFQSFSKVYGSIGAVIVLLIWLYWSSIIIFVGSELNALLSDKKGCRNES